MKTLLVTGISGFLGHYMLNDAQEEWEIIGTYHKQKNFVSTERHVQHEQLDLSDKEAIQSLVEKINPAAIIHLAACSQPNFCELNQQESMAINVEATKLLCQEAEKREIPFVFTSTDLVFDGLNAPYLEEDAPSPINLYGHHKAMAEKLIAQIYPAAIIARMPLMYGMTPNKPGFMGAWLKQLGEGKTINAFTDEYRTAVSGRDGAAGLFLLLRKQVNGIWHLGGAERMSRYHFACQLAIAFGYSKALIKGGLQKEVQMAAARPPDVSLNSNKAFELGYRPEHSLEALKREFNKNQNNVS